MVHLTIPEDGPSGTSISPTSFSSASVEMLSLTQLQLSNDDEQKTRYRKCRGALKMRMVFAARSSKTWMIAILRTRWPTFCGIAKNA